MRPPSFININHFFYTATVLTVLLVAGCTTSSKFNACDGDSSISLEYGGCLTIEDANLSTDERISVEQTIRQTHSLVHEMISVNNVRILVVEDPAQTIPELGIGGFNPNDEEVHTSIDIMRFLNI